jgi:hypothetical protein
MIDWTPHPSRASAPREAGATKRNRRCNDFGTKTDAGNLENALTTWTATGST